MFKFVYLSIALLALVSGEKFRFENYSLFRIVPENVEQVKLLQNLKNNEEDYDFWNEPVTTTGFVNIMTSPEKTIVLENTLNYHGIKYEITMSNVQEAIDKETVSTYTRNNPRNMTWDAYYTLEDIEAWMGDLATTYPEASQIVGGVSFEGREIKGLKISHGSGRKIIFVESGLHAREWITVTTACYLIKELLMSDDPDTRAAAQNFDWHIFPVTNPDGYIWSHTTFRMWRKNRRPIIDNHVGVDLNRNWNSNWLVYGSSSNPWTDNFAGNGPFSEPETRTLSRYLRNVGEIDMYLSVHSFGHLLLLPFGNTTAPLANYHDAMNIGRRAMGAITVRHGTQYTTGNIAEAIYFATGGSIDWVKEALEVPLVYCYELRDQGQYGFLLPTDQILPNNQEVMDSILELIHQARRFGYLNSRSSSLHSSVLIMVLSVMQFIWNY